MHFITLSELSPYGEQYNVLTVKHEPTPLHYFRKPYYFNFVPNAVLLRDNYNLLSALKISVGNCLTSKGGCEVSRLV